MALCCERRLYIAFISIDFKIRPLQVPSEQQKDLMRLDLREELESEFRARLASLGEETDAYKVELNKTKYQYTFLKSEYEQEKREQQQIVEELKLQYETEVSMKL